jgi:holo-[acyl-carrier protein] synthase
MQNISIGIDIEEISRFSEKKIEHNRTFYKKIFTKKEMEYCMKKKNPYQHFTVRFCAKEATIKALKNKKIDLIQIEIIIKNNIPSLKLPYKIETSLSLSHTNTYATAVVLILNENTKYDP